MGIWNLIEHRKNNLIPDGNYNSRIWDMSYDISADLVKLTISYKIYSSKFLDQPIVSQDFQVNSRGFYWMIWQFELLGLNKLAKEIYPEGEDYILIAKAYMRAFKAIKGHGAYLNVRTEEYNGEVINKIYVHSIDQYRGPDRSNGSQLRYDDGSIKELPPYPDDEERPY